MAQGGNQQGYALHLAVGKPIFSVRINGKLTFITARDAVTGPIPVQPKDGLTIGKDLLSAVGDYAVPHTFRGKVENVRIQ